MDREQKLLAEMARMNLLADPKLTVSYKYLISYFIYFDSIRHKSQV